MQSKKVVIFSLEILSLKMKYGVGNSVNTQRMEKYMARCLLISLLIEVTNQTAIVCGRK